MTYNFIYSSTPGLGNAEIKVETNNKICQKDERYLSNPLSFDCNSFYKFIYVSSDKKTSIDDFDVVFDNVMEYFSADFYGSVFVAGVKLLILVELNVFVQLL